MLSESTNTRTESAGILQCKRYLYPNSDIGLFSTYLSLAWFWHVLVYTCGDWCDSAYA
jgi:hypothetical protein